MNEITVDEDAYNRLAEAPAKYEKRIAELEAERDELKSIHLDFFRYAKQEALDAVLVELGQLRWYNIGDYEKAVRKIESLRRGEGNGND